MNKISKLNIQIIILSGTVSSMATIILQKIIVTATDPLWNLTGTILFLLFIMGIMYSILHKYLCYEPLKAKFRLDGYDLIGEFSSHPKRKLILDEINFQASIHTGQVIHKPNKLLLNVEIEVTEEPKEVKVYSFHTQIIDTSNIINFEISYLEESEKKYLPGSVMTKKPTNEIT